VLDVKGQWTITTYIALNPDWKPSGKAKDAVSWTKAQVLTIKHPTMSADQAAKLADCGVATVYRIKRETT